MDMAVFHKLSKLGTHHAGANHINPFLGFTVRKSIIQHDVFCDAVKNIAEIHQRGLTARVTGGLLITGQTGSGKTTLAKFYKGHFPRRELADRTVSPVLYVTTPESPTVKSLAESILVALNDPYAARGSTDEKTRRIFRFLEECRVELLIIDEFQHFWDSRLISQARKVTDWVKNLFNIANLPVVLIGLPRSVMVVRMNPQLKRRFAAPYYLQPFTFDGPQEEKQFRAVLKSIHEMLPLECPPLHEANLARQFYFATAGLMDFLVKIVDSAVLSAGEMNAPALTLQHFAHAFQKEVWRDAPKVLNPFEPNAHLRPLTRIGEPFELWDDPKQYESQTAA